MSSPQRGIFRSTRRASDAPDETEIELLQLLEAQDYRRFHAPGGRSRKNILVSGPTAPARRPSPRR